MDLTKIIFTILCLIYVCHGIECPTGWTTGLNTCYLFHQVLLTWSESSHYCRSLGAHLARVESVQEKNVMAEELKHFSGDFWLDGIDDVNEGDWRWASAYDERITPTFWSPSEPNNSHGDEDCMETGNGRQGLWNDYPCTNRLFSICEKDQDL